MVDSVTIDADDVARVQVLLTIEGCPMRGRIEQDTAEATATVPGLSRVEVSTSAMNEEQRRELTNRLRQGRRQIPFNQAGSLTRIYAISSGKGGVGKSTVTANLAAAMAADGLRVGVIDADIHGFSMPGMFGITAQPTKVLDLLIASRGARRRGDEHRHVRPGGAGRRMARPEDAPRDRAVRLRRVLGRSGRAAAGPPSGHRRRGDLRGAAAAERADGGGDHAPAVRGDGRGAGRFARVLDGAGDRRGRGEHGRADPAGRLRDGCLRGGRWRPGRGDARRVRRP